MMSLSMLDIDIRRINGVSIPRGLTDLPPNSMSVRYEIDSQIRDE